MRKAAPKTGIADLQAKPFPIVLGDITVQLYPLDLNDLAEFEEAIGPLSFLQDPATQARAVRFVLWRSLLHGDEAATLQDAGRLIKASDLDRLSEAMAVLFSGETDAGSGE
jgi:hypothetical protein